MEGSIAARGFWSWFLQRFSGLFLAFFLGVHIVALHFAREWKVSFETVLHRLQNNPFIMVFYLLFIPTVVYHGLNGLWGIVLDYAPSEGTRRAFFLGLWALGVAATLFGLWVLIALKRMIT